LNLENLNVSNIVFFFIINKDASRNALGLGNVAGIFYILIIGLVISVIIAAFEVLYKARLEAKRSKVIENSVSF